MEGCNNPSYNQGGLYNEKENRKFTYKIQKMAFYTRLYVCGAVNRLTAEYAYISPFKRQIEQ